MRQREILGGGSTDDFNFNVEKQEIKELQTSLSANMHTENFSIGDPEKVNVANVKAKLIKQKSLLESFQSVNEEEPMAKGFSKSLRNDKNIRNRALKALDYAKWAFSAEIIDNIKISHTHPIEMITQLIPTLTQEGTLSIDQSWKLVIFSKYLAILNTELSVYKSEYETEYLIKQAEESPKSSINTNFLKKIEEYEGKWKKWQELQGEVLNTCSDIMAQQSDLSDQEREEFNKLRQEAQEEAKKAQEEVKRQNEKSKLEQVIDAVILILKRPPTPKIPEIPNTPNNTDTNEKIEKLKHKRKLLGDLLEMYKEYQVYFQGVYNDKKNSFKDRIANVKETIANLDDQELIDRSANELLSEAIKIGGNIPNDRDAFMEEYTKLRKDSYENHLGSAKNKDENFKPSDHLFMGIGEGRKLFNLLMKYKVFTGTSDLIWKLTVYNGKKYVNISTRSLKYSGMKWLDFLTAGSLNLPLEEYEKNLEIMDFNEKETMLIALYRQTKFLGQWGSMVAKGVISAGGLAVMDRRAGGSIMKGGIQSFFTPIKNHAGMLEDYLILAQKNLGDNNGKLGTLNKYVTNGNVSEVLGGIFDDVRTIEHVVARSEKNKSFQSAQEASQSLTQYLNKIEGLPNESKKRLIDQISTDLKKVTLRGDNRWKRELGGAISHHINSTCSGLVHGMYKNWLPKKLQEAIVPTIRQDVARMSKQLSALGSYYSKYLNFTSESNTMLRIAKKYGLAKITKLRISQAVSQITSIGRTSFARIGSVKEIKELTANLDIVMKFAPNFASSFLRSAPILSMTGHLSRQDNKEVQSSLVSLAAMVCPLWGPLYIMNDAAGSQGFKAGEFGIGAFFFAGDSITLAKYAMKAAIPGQSGTAIIKEYLKRTVLDPFYAAAEIPKLLYSGGKSTVKLVGDVATKKFPNGKGKMIRPRKKLTGMAGIAALLIYGGWLYLEKEGESFDTGVRNSYIKYRVGESEFEGFTDPKEGAREYIKDKWPLLEKNMKEDILQFEANLFLHNYTPTIEEIQTRLDKGVNDEPYKPGVVDIKLTAGNEILVLLDKVIPYKEYLTFAEKFKDYINTTIPDGGSLGFRTENLSFLYGKSVFENEISRIDIGANSGESSLEKFKNDMKNNYREKFSYWQQKLSSSLSRGNIGAGYENRWITSWINWYIIEYIK